MKSEVESPVCPTCGHNNVSRGGVCQEIVAFLHRCLCKCVFPEPTQSLEGVVGEKLLGPEAEAHRLISEYADRDDMGRLRGEIADSLRSAYAAGVASHVPVARAVREVAEKVVTHTQTLSHPHPEWRKREVIIIAGIITSTFSAAAASEPPYSYCAVHNQAAPCSTCETVTTPANQHDYLPVAEQNQESVEMQTKPLDPTGRGEKDIQLNQFIDWQVCLH